MILYRRVMQGWQNQVVKVGGECLARSQHRGLRTWQGVERGCAGGKNVSNEEKEYNSRFALTQKLVSHQLESHMAAPPLSAVPGPW